MPLIKLGSSEVKNEPPRLFLPAAHSSEGLVYNINDRGQGQVLTFKVFQKCIPVVPMAMRRQKEPAPAVPEHLPTFLYFLGIIRKRRIYNAFEESNHGVTHNSDFIVNNDAG